MPDCQGLPFACACSRSCAWGCLPPLQLPQCYPTLGVRGLKGCCGRLDVFAPMGDIFCSSWVSSSTSSIRGNNSPSPPSRRGHCAVRLAFPTATCSPECLCWCLESAGSRHLRGSRRSAACGLFRSLSIRLPGMASRFTGAPLILFSSPSSE
jgi:hypothetical protein